MLKGDEVQLTKGGDEVTYAYGHDVPGVKLFTCAPFTSVVLPVAVIRSCL